MEDEVFDRAAALSYYFMFALFPILLIVMVVLGTLHLDLMDGLIRALDAFVPSDVVRNTMAELTRNSSGGLLSFGIIAALWSASSGMSALMVAVNVAFDTIDPRPWWKRQLIALALTVGCVTMILLGLVLLLFGDELRNLVSALTGAGPWLATAWSIGRWVMIVVLLDVVINLLYYLSLAQHPGWHLLTPGSTVAMAGWILMSLGLQWAMLTFLKFGATYGSVGGVIALLLWLYCTGVLILVGAEIESEIGRDWREVRGMVVEIAKDVSRKPKNVSRKRKQ